MMAFWKMVLLLLFLPLALSYRAATVILGKERARRLFHDAIVAVSARVLAWNIPTLKKGQPFAVFSERFVRVLSRMPFETIRVTIQTEDTFQINITRCQFVEVFRLLGMPELIPALCRGDVIFCEKFQPLVRFERLHTLAAGDGFCDHTYYFNDKKEP
jgi:hypothetical protein